MLKLWILFVCANGVAAFPLQAGPLKNPKRIVNEAAVDLTPLFHWWTNRSGARPLGAWVHVTGQITGTNGWGWVLNAHVAGPGRKNEEGEKGKSGQMNIVLKNPPRAEQAEFEQLNNQLKELTASQKALSAQAAEADRHVKAITEQEKGTRQHHSRVLAHEAATWRQTETSVKDQLKPVEKQINALNTRLAAFPSHDRYAVDCLALDTGEEIGGQPIYDHGLVQR